jgi:hypothetical protein
LWKRRQAGLPTLVVPGAAEPGDQWRTARGLTLWLSLRGWNMSCWAYLADLWVRGDDVRPGEPSI